MGSTSYDEARDPADATWSGASWYGPSSGEYWIVNPREYADPRKHGPDYQSRARRPTTGDDAAIVEEADPIGEPAWTSGPRAEPETSRAEGSSAIGATDPARQRGPAAGSRAWAAAAGRPAWTAPDGSSSRGGQASPSLSPDATGRGLPGDGPDRTWRPPLAATTRDVLGRPADDPIRRLGLALLAWPPIGLAAAAAIGQVTGCSIYSADCVGPDTILPWLAQAIVLGLLLLLPPMARLFASGTVAVVFALVPVTGFLVVIGGGGQPEAGFALAFLLALTWLIGVAWAVVSARRRGASLGVEQGAGRAG